MFTMDSNMGSLRLHQTACLVLTCDATGCESIGRPQRDRKVMFHYLGVSINDGTPIAGWFISWKIRIQNGGVRGTPIYGNPYVGRNSLFYSSGDCHTLQIQTLPQIILQ